MTSIWVKIGSGRIPSGVLTKLGRSAMKKVCICSLVGFLEIVHNIGARSVLEGTTLSCQQQCHIYFLLWMLCVIEVQLFFCLLIRLSVYARLIFA